VPPCVGSCQHSRSPGLDYVHLNIFFETISVIAFLCWQLSTTAIQKRHLKALVTLSPRGQTTRRQPPEDPLWQDRSIVHRAHYCAYPPPQVTRRQTPNDRLNPQLGVDSCLPTRATNPPTCSYAHIPKKRSTLFVSWQLSTILLNNDVSKRPVTPVPKAHRTASIPGLNVKPDSQSIATTPN
jgi:hypothetical protein